MQVSNKTRHAQKAMLKIAMNHKRLDSVEMNALRTGQQEPRYFFSQSFLQVSRNVMDTWGSLRDPREPRPPKTSSSIAFSSSFEKGSGDPGKPTPPRKCLCECVKGSKKAGKAQGG